jgi:Na+/H+ antiporter NhaD/arsenite permease-like protein
MLWAMAAGEWSRAIALAAFVASYVGLALGRVPGFRIDRTGVAIIGAAVMVASGAVPWPDAVAAVDAPTLVLLFGMMIVTAYLRLSGFFRLVMTWALRRARTPLALLGAVVLQGRRPGDTGDALSRLAPARGTETLTYPRRSGRAFQK